MARKIPAEQDVIGAPPYPVEDPVANASYTEVGKAAVYAPAGRDGTGTHQAVRAGVIMPDGTTLAVGETFTPEVERVSPAALEYWLRWSMVVCRKQTKEFKGETVAKG